MKRSRKLAEGKSWRSKLEREHASHGKIVKIPPAMRKSFGHGTMLIPRPLDLDALIRKIPKGRLATQSRIRETLARRAGADRCCPFTSGIFFRIVAETAEEDRRAGKKRIAPYWRVVRDDGSLIDKFPGGVAAQAKKLQAEGLTVSKGRVVHPRFS